MKIVKIRSEEFMSMLKKLVNLFVENPTPNLLDVTKENLEERLKEFENEALQNRIKTLEKAVVFLSQKIEVQTEVIRRQGEALKDIHTTIEEIANIFDTVQKINNGNIEEDIEDDLEENSGKKYVN
jgi:biotin-(acetyl-CoA carboxylase) ligase